MLGGFLALMSALTFALNNASARRGVLTGSVLQAMAISVPFGVPFLFVATILFGGYAALGKFSMASLLWLSAAGIVHFVMGRYCNYRGTKAIGANLVGPLQDMNIIYSMGMAVFWLGERLTVLKFIGFVLVMFGPVMTLRQRSRSAKEVASGKAALRKPSTFTPVYAEGYLFALLSGLCYGTSPILVRQGLVSSDLATSVAASFISYSAATVVVCLIMLVPGAIQDVKKIDRNAGKWFLIAGLFVAVSQMLRYMALAVAPVTVVAPIGRLSSIFRVYFGWLINREHEVFSSRVIFGTIVSLFGALVLSLDTGYLISLGNLPDWMVDALKWRWP